MKIFFFFKEASKSQMRLDDLGELQFLSLQSVQGHQGAAGLHRDPRGRQQVGIF